MSRPRGLDNGVGDGVAVRSPNASHRSSHTSHRGAAPVLSILMTVVSRAGEMRPKRITWGAALAVIDPSSPAPVGCQPLIDLMPENRAASSRRISPGIAGNCRTGDLRQPPSPWCRPPAIGAATLRPLAAHRYRLRSLPILSVWGASAHHRDDVAMIAICVRGFGGISSGGTQLPHPRHTASATVCIHRARQPSARARTRVRSRSAACRRHPRQRRRRPCGRRHGRDG